MERVTFDGYEITQYHDVIGIVRTAPYMTPNLVMAGETGRYSYGGRTMVPPRISFTILANSGMEDRRRREFHELANVLMVSDFVKVAFSTDDGLYYMAIPDTELSEKQYVMDGRMDVSMQCDSIAKYGREHSVTVPSGGSKTFIVGGNHKAYPVIETSLAVRANGIWGVRLDEQGYSHVSLPSSSASSVTIDCAEQLCSVNGYASMITLDSDWLELEPGERTIRNDAGTGACTVTWQERWV